HDLRQKVVEYGPLIVTSHLELHSVKRPCRVQIDQAIMKTLHHALELGNYDVLVVAWIADDRSLVPVACCRHSQNVARLRVALDQEEFLAKRQLRAVIEIRLICGTSAVNVV